MERFFPTDDFDGFVEIKECPKCQVFTTFLRLKKFRKDAILDLEEEEFYRCMQCLTLFEPELKEIKGEE